jgi:hypothetical protein
MKRSFEEISANARDWAALPQVDREPTYKVNRLWFIDAPVYESSIFLYFDLSQSPDVVQYAESVQDVCRASLGGDGFNQAPTRRLHVPLFTEVVLRNARLPDSRVAEVRSKYEALLNTMDKSIVFVLGPRLTPGGVVLECRVFDDSISSARATASSMANKEEPPRIPKIDYATLGYITAGTSEELERLNVRLKSLSESQAPIAAAIDRVYTSLTVNKRLTGPTLTTELTLPVRVVLPPGGMRDSMSDDRELKLIAVAQKYLTQTRD